jgi:hypothetical protein
VESIVEWIRKKTGTPSNRINNHQELVEKTRSLDYLVVYLGPLHIGKFKTYLELARDFIQQDDLEFAHIDTTRYPE